MDTLKAIIVEDENIASQNLRYKLETYCPKIEVVAECNTSKKAIQKIKRIKPDVVFLDIHLDSLTGFQVLESIPFTAFDVIITTDHNRYAIDAIKVQVVDFLTKPIRKKELINSVEKLVEKKEQKKNHPGRLSLPISNGEKYIDTNQLIYLQSKNTRCEAFILSDSQDSTEEGEFVELTRLLGEMEIQLKKHGFCRPNNQVLLNLAHIKEYIRKDGGWIIMSNGKAFNIANAYRAKFNICRNNWFM